MFNSSVPIRRATGAYLARGFPQAFRQKSSFPKVSAKLIDAQDNANLGAPTANVVSHRGHRAGERSLVIKIPISSEKTAPVPWFDVLAGDTEAVGTIYREIIKRQQITVKREIIYNLYYFLSHSTASGLRGGPACSRKAFIELLAIPTREGLLKDLLENCGSSLVPSEIYEILDVKSLGNLSQDVHSCSLKQAFDTAEALHKEKDNGRLLLAAISLITGYDRRPSEKAILETSLAKLRKTRYDDVVINAAFSKDIISLIEELKREQVRRFIQEENGKVGR